MYACVRMYGIFYLFMLGPIHSHKIVNYELWHNSDVCNFHSRVEWMNIFSESHSDHYVLIEFKAQLSLEWIILEPTVLTHPLIYNLCLYMANIMPVDTWYQRYLTQTKQNIQHNKWMWWQLNFSRKNKQLCKSITICSSSSCFHLFYGRDSWMRALLKDLHLVPTRRHA